MNPFRCILCMFRSRDVMVVTTLDTLTSLLAGSIIFGILGNLAHERGTSDISKVTRGGASLAFISYPDALSRFDIFPQFFSALFYFMMFVLGIGTAVALFQGVSNVFHKLFPEIHQLMQTAGLCLLGFLIGILYITQVKI